MTRGCKELSNCVRGFCVASDRQQFMRANAHWEKLNLEGHYSVPIEIGTTAIISSRFTDDEPDSTTGVTELASFRNEALALADRIHHTGRATELAIDATRNDITRLIQDPNIVSMYMIGNGSLSALILDIEDRYDWYDAAVATNHVKLGMFIQRQCGGLTRKVNVPLGLFVVNDPRNVLAAVGVEFYPLSLGDEENRKIKPVFNPGSFSYQSIKKMSVVEQNDRTSGSSPDEIDENINIIELRRLAFLLPKIPEMDSCIPPATISKSYDNFYKRFPEIKAVAEGKASESQITYVRMVKERFGLDLLDFYSQYSELCNEICGIILEKQPYDRLTADYEKLKILEFNGAVPPGSVDKLNLATNHTLGLVAIGLYYSSKLNPLLEKAYALFEPLTLNTPFLTL